MIHALIIWAIVSQQTDSLVYSQGVIVQDQHQSGLLALCHNNEKCGSGPYGGGSAFEEQKRWTLESQLRFPERPAASQINRVATVYHLSC